MPKMMKQARIGDHRRKQVVHVVAFYWSRGREYFGVDGHYIVVACAYRWSSFMSFYSTGQGEGRLAHILLSDGAVVSSSTAVGHHLSNKRSVRRAHDGFTDACRLVIRKEAWELVWLSLSE